MNELAFALNATGHERDAIEIAKRAGVPLKIAAKIDVFMDDVLDELLRTAADVKARADRAASR